jgi:hypothetical protein
VSEVHRTPISVVRSPCKDVADMFILSARLRTLDVATVELDGATLDPISR